MKAPPQPEPDDDLALFRAQLQGVRPHHDSRADTGKPRSDRSRLQALRDNASQTAGAPVVDGLSDLFVIDVGAEDSLYWARDGVQDGQMRQLKAGQIPFAASLDLHGMSVEKARSTLNEFLAEACRREVRCVRVTHGKAARLDGSRPLLKSHVNTWLRQHPQLLGFCSCLPRHGGSGALYLLLKRHALDGRELD